jgi:hypothetical protein
MSVCVKYIVAERATNGSNKRLCEIVPFFNTAEKLES